MPIEPHDPKSDDAAAGTPFDDAPTAGEGDTITLDPSAARAEIGLREGETLGPYRLLEVIGIGGFGVVWLAEQREPIRRRVALKVIKPGMDSAAVIARFEAERNALSVMDHPNIARVLDGGTTERGLPYFVMEHVPGEPITSYCARRKLGLRERLIIFGQVCQAVQHAHTKGVIHRDLKPTNILVREVDDDPVAKVIDFGVAKALDQRLSEATLFTARGHFVGTPEYMAPEQAEGSGRDIDTRADVYSLGVVLYELLSGHRPFDLTDVAWRELTRVLSEVAPPRPSTRVFAALESSSDSESRHIARSTARALRSDLDWVVMRCLEKERSRRYETASGLGDDIRRFLAGEAVEAGPPSVAYRVGKTFRRHRPLIVSGAAVAALVTVTAVVAAAGWARALANEAAAKEKLIAIVREGLRRGWPGTELIDRAAAAGIAVETTDDGPSGEERSFFVTVEGGDEVPRLAAFAEELFEWSSAATAQAARSDGSRRRLIDFVRDEVIGVARPRELGPAVTVLDAVMRSMPRIDGYDLDDAVKSDFAAKLARVFFDAGRPADAATLARVAERAYAASSPQSPERLINRLSLAAALSVSGQLDASAEEHETLARDAADHPVFGPEHPFTLAVLASRVVNRSRSGDYATALREHEELLRRRAAADGPDSPGAISSRISIAHARAEMLEHAEAPEADRAANVDELRGILDDMRRLGIEGALVFRAAATLVRASVDAGAHGEALTAADAWIGDAAERQFENAGELTVLRYHRGRALIGLGRSDEGFNEMRRAIDAYAGPGPSDRRTQIVMRARLVDALRSAGHPDAGSERAALADLGPLSRVDPAFEFVRTATKD